jgi:Transposase DDE domain
VRRLAGHILQWLGFASKSGVTAIEYGLLAAIDRSRHSRCGKTRRNELNQSLHLCRRQGGAPIKGGSYAALRNRGSLTIWISEEALADWKAHPRTAPGGQRYYSDLAIETALTQGAVFRLALSSYPKCKHPYLLKTTR